MLLIFAVPVMGIIVAAIWITDGRPALFSQVRVGQFGKRFRILKFRTMYRDVESYAPTPRDQNDPRVTRVGRFLRRTSLDELPQLFNVLRGEMSLVGPRPEMPFIVDQYTPTQRERLLAKPGLTGLWQISADRAFEIHENIDYDLYYIRNRSILLDLVILLHTLVFAIRGVGAF
jgi:lipopolysaccharide/colanic/teichoic acid biosynthesis glycosyltransferase